MRKAVLVSGLLHIVVFVLAWASNPFANSSPLDLDQFTAIEVAVLAEMPRTSPEIFVRPKPPQRPVAPKKMAPRALPKPSPPKKAYVKPKPPEKVVVKPKPPEKVVVKPKPPEKVVAKLIESKKVVPKRRNKEVMVALAVAKARKIVPTIKSESIEATVPVPKKPPETKSSVDKLLPQKPVIKTVSSSKVVVDHSPILKTIEKLKRNVPQKSQDSSKRLRKNLDVALKKYQKNLQQKTVHQEKHKPEKKLEEKIAEATMRSQTVPKPKLLGNSITMSERDAVRRHIEQCWSIPTGARDAKDLVVDIRLRLRPDGTVAAASIEDKKRLMSDNFFRTAAESALRAVQNPRCSTIPVPPKKYEIWKDMVLSFSPQHLY